MCHAEELGSYAQGQGHIRSEVKLCLKSCLRNNSNTTQANFMKLHKKMKQNEKVCHTQILGSHIQGQGHNQGSANFFKLHITVNHN